MAATVCPAGQQLFKMNEVRLVCERAVHLHVPLPPSSAFLRAFWQHARASLCSCLGPAVEVACVLHAHAHHSPVSLSASSQVAPTLGAVDSVMGAEKKRRKPPRKTRPKGEGESGDAAAAEGNNQQPNARAGPSQENAAQGPNTQGESSRELLWRVW